MSLTVGFQRDFLELLFHFHGTLRRLKLQEPEYVLMAAMSLFSPGEHFPQPRNCDPATCVQMLDSLNAPTSSHSASKPRGSVPSAALWAACRPPLTLTFPAPYLTDRPGVTQREEVDQLQQCMALTLDSYIKGQQLRSRNRYVGLETAPTKGSLGKHRT